MSGKIRACYVCQRNGRLTCRRYSDSVRAWNLKCHVLMVVLFQDQAGGALLEDIPLRVCGFVETGQNCFSSRTHPQGMLQTDPVGGSCADAGGT